MKGSNLNVQLLKLECSLEDASKLILVLYQVVKNVAEKPVKDDKSSVDLCLVISLDEGEEEVEQVLPDAVVLLINHGALNFDSNIANFVDQSLVSGIDTLQSLENCSLDGLTGGFLQALPQVNVVVLVGQVRRVRSLRAYISAKDDGSKAFSFN